MQLFLCLQFGVQYLKSFICLDMKKKKKGKNRKKTMNYADLNFKIPVESKDYKECSDFVIKHIEDIISDAIKGGENRIIINTNLRLGLPMENINKVAGPFVEAWAFETFSKIFEAGNNKYELINVQANERLNKSDIILQFKKQRAASSGLTCEIDVKATANDIVGSGKSPNITSFAVIRTAYIDEPDLIFIILSLKHKVYSTKNEETKLMDGIMEVVDYNAYDIKYLSSPDISYNPALGTGQIQIRDIHYVDIEERDVWEFCQLLDKKFLSSTRRTFENWLQLAKRFNWIKDDE